jgi:hypothetical protein
MLIAGLQPPTWISPLVAPAFTLVLIFIEVIAFPLKVDAVLDP